MHSCACMSRRSFLSAGTGAAALATLGGPARVSAAPSALVTLDLSNASYTALNTIGGAVKVPDPGAALPMIVVRTSQTAVAAFSSRCTHMGCEVGLPVGGVVSCPCHNSTYTNTGVRTGGPAPSNLTAYAASLTGSIVTIDTNPASVGRTAAHSASSSAVRVQREGADVIASLSDSREAFAMSVYSAAGRRLYHAELPPGAVGRWHIATAGLSSCMVVVQCAGGTQFAQWVPTGR
jgi:cytochrome b6-f complex iron-sulfur subunit